jgi:hypothetical protein
VVLSTVLAVIGCAGTGALWGLLRWMRREYQRDIQSRDETKEFQEEQIQRLRYLYELEQKSVSERDETIDGLIAKIEGLDKSYQVRCRELDARNCELLAMRNKAKEIFATSFASNSASDSDQPQKLTCDN